ncbi:MAG: cytochrome C oxidase subunit IV family protein [Candidatus Omnitrophota bacterium]|nr:cytochrome C oxidase subunit IV family protein [Candidatus Omnitrophota bacterium]
MSSDHHDIQKEVRGYMIVFVALMAGTIITVAVSYFHLPLIKAITVALLVATIKASLVVCYFMHLISEKKLIYIVLSLTVVFFLGLLSLPALEYHSLPEGTQHKPFTIENTAPPIETHHGEKEHVS